MGISDGKTELQGLLLDAAGSFVIRGFFDGCGGSDPHPPSSVVVSKGDGEPARLTARRSWLVVHDYMVSATSRVDEVTLLTSTAAAITCGRGRLLVDNTSAPRVSTTCTRTFPILPRLIAITRLYHQCRNVLSAVTYLMPRLATRMTLACKIAW